MTFGRTRPPAIGSAPRTSNRRDSRVPPGMVAPARIPVMAHRYGASLLIKTSQPDRIALSDFAAMLPR
jgi:hypothetical protein